MCGILGYLGPKEIQREFVDALEAMSMRGPDGSGSRFEPIGSDWLHLGHRRLSILDLSDSASQPMVSKRTGNILTFNGEIYNFPEIRTELEKLGYTFHSSGDTEVLLSAYDEWGESCLDKLNGMFAFAIWDKQQEYLFLARDRIGIKPLYYTFQNGSFGFSSMLLPLARLPEFQTELNPSAFNDYFAYGYFPWNSTPLKNFSKLPPGHSLKVTAKGQVADPTPYWAPETFTKTQTVKNEEETISTLQKHLSESVERRLISDVPVGCFLSGGIDSSLITALACNQSVNKVQTFTIGFTVPEQNEPPYAKAIADHLGTDHHELYITPDILRDSLHEVLESIDEPFLDSSFIPTYLLSQFAREKVSVALSGDGGDELHFGYGHYFAALKWLKFSEKPRILRKMAELACKIHPSKRFKRWGDFILSENISEFFVSQMADSNAGLFSKLENGQAAERLKELGSRYLGDDPAGFPLLADLSQFLPDDLLVKGDRASMAHSLELRVPLLDHNHVEYALSLPVGLRKGSNGKNLLKQILYDFVPKELIERPKRGFSIPIGHWFRNELREWCEAEMSEMETWGQGLFDPARVRELWAAHLSGKQNHSRQIWAIIVLKKWLDRLAQK